MKIKLILSLMLALILTLSFVSCADRVTRDEAKDQVNSLLNAVEESDFDNAAKLLHPNREFDIEGLFTRAETEYSVDFQSGIEIKRYTGFSSALYESEVDGSEYELEMDITVSGRVLELTVDIVRNDSGFGIYEIDIDD
ncbi:MAG: hypothetical protein IJ039_07755 [Clostridia bacterium]|nr:hypothetical protein [Clostridia bacterium]